jgi:hypothetical protein
MLCLYIVSLPQDMVWGDAPELAASAWILGVPHPTGYPLYMLCVHLFQHVPFGTVIFRAHLFSACCAAAALFFLVLFFHGILLRIYKTDTALIRVSAILGGVAYASNPIAWDIAIQTEVYAMFALLFSMTLYLLPKLQENPQKNLPLFFFLAGLQVVHHRLAIFLLAIVALYAINNGYAKKRMTHSRLLYSAGFVIPPLCLLLYFPIRASSDPAINWYNPQTFASAYELFSGGHFNQILQSGLQRIRVMRIYDLFSILILPFFTYGLLGLLAIVGQMTLMKSEMWLGWIIRALFVIYQLFLLIYLTGDWQTFLLPGVLVLSLPLAIGFASILENLQKVQLHTPVTWIASALLVLCSTFPLCVSKEFVSVPIPAKILLPAYKNCAERFVQVNHRGTTDYGNNVWAVTPEHAVILTGLSYATADNEAYPLLYQQIVENQGANSVIVGAGFMYLDWYRNQISRQINVPLPPRHDQLYTTREASLLDLWDTLIEPVLDQRPVISTSFPQPTDIITSMSTKFLKTFTIDNEGVPAFYYPYLPTGFVFTVERK